MANTKPARGMRDFLPADVRKRNYVIGIIKEVYESYGFEPLETPSVENIETLTGKYGEEGNQLIFKILKRGEKLEEELQSYGVAELQSSTSSDSETPQLRNSENSLSDLALRYDLTVPLARVVANNRNELPKFFKRYQIQPVWRADRPARGRFREFYQCDVDAIGSSSMVVEAELIAAVSEILKRLGRDEDKKNFTDFVILANHRDVLFGLLQAFGIAEERRLEVLIAIDKTEKIGINGVIRELVEKATMAESKASEFAEALYFGPQTVHSNPDSRSETEKLDDQNVSYLEKFESLIGNTSSGRNGLYAIRNLLALTENSSAKGHIRFQPSLARGLSYYTGSIFEIGLNRLDFSGSIGGGGRYDGLIGMFGKERIPACGFSLGLERILVVMDERNMFPPEIAASNSADVMVTIWNEDSIAESLKLSSELRQQGLRVTVYPEAEKLGKQLKYADTINVPFACILGDEEKEQGKIQLKDMRSGEKFMLTVAEIVQRLRA